MERELSDEEVEQIVRQGNYLEVPGLARAVQGQELLSVKKVLAFQPEARRINTVLQMMTGWKLSGLLLFRDGRALALIVRSDDELPFAERFPHADYAMAVEYVEGVAQLRVAKIAQETKTKPRSSPTLDETRTESTPTISGLVDGATTESELARAPDVPADEMDSAALSQEAAGEPQVEEIGQGREFNTSGPSELSLRVDELESRLQIDRELVERQLPSLSATTPTAPALVQRSDGTSRPLTLPPTELLRAPPPAIEHRSRVIISTVVMIDPLEKRARLQNGDTVFVKDGIEQLELHKKCEFKTIASAREERFIVFPVEVVQELEDGLLVSVS